MSRCPGHCRRAVRQWPLRQGSTGHGGSTEGYAADGAHARARSSRRARGAVHAPRGGAVARLPHLPARAGDVPGFHRHQDRPPGQWVGIENFQYLAGDAVTQLALFNTLFYTIVACVIKFVLGLWLALLLNKHIPFKAAMRAVVLLPFIVPTALSAIAFWWIYDSQFSI